MPDLADCIRVVIYNPRQNILEVRKISSEKINYAIFFVIAVVIVSGAIYIEKPASLASAIPFESGAEGLAGDGGGETNDDNADTAQQTTQESPEGDGDGETNDD